MKIYIIFLIFILCGSKSPTVQAQKNDLHTLQNIINNSGAKLTLLKKNYTIYGTLDLKNNLSIDGNGSTIIQKKPSTPIFNLEDKENIIVEGFTLKGFKNDYQPSSSSMAVGLYCWGSKNLVIKNNKFLDFSYSGISGLREVFKVEVFNNNFVGTGNFDNRYYQKDHTGITLGGENIKIYNNNISNSSQGIIIAEKSMKIEIYNNVIHDLPLEHGIYVDYGCSEIYVYQNKISNVVGCGIKVQNRSFPDAISKYISIYDNEINNTKVGDGILVTNSEGNLLFAEYVTIKNNILKNIGQHGINMRISKNGKILANKIEDVKHSGIYLRENYDLTIDKNKITNTAESGIFDEGTGERILISNNILNNVGTDGIDKNGLNSGIFIEAGSYRIVKNNIVKGYQNKMRYGLYIANGDQKTMEVSNNQFSGARDYGIRLSESKTKLKKMQNNSLNASIGKSEMMNKPNN